MADQDPAAVGRDGDSAAGIVRSGGALQDAVGGSASGGTFVSAALAGATPFLWPGGLPAAPLGALLAAVGMPPAAWPGLPIVASTAGPGLPGAHAGASTTGSGLLGAHTGAADRAQRTGRNHCTRCRDVGRRGTKGRWPRWLPRVFGHHSSCAGQLSHRHCSGADGQQ